MLTTFLGTRLPRLARPLFRGVLWRGDPGPDENSPYLYLTFDDGPYPECTPHLLELLGDAGCGATFFFQGSNAELHPEHVRETAEAGHVVGNHGWLHRSAWRAPGRETITGFGRTESLLQDLSAQPARLVRPPYGRFTPALYAWSRQEGRQPVLWDLMPGDFLPGRGGAVASRVVEQIARHALPGSIVVLHERPQSEEILEAVRQVLSWVRANGWTASSL